MKLPELKPCPFCKGKPKREGHAYSGKFLGIEHEPKFEQLKWYGIKCTACGIAQPKRKYHSREESDAAWNNRPE